MCSASAALKTRQTVELVQKFMYHLIYQLMRPLTWGSLLRLGLSLPPLHLWHSLGSSEGSLGHTHGPASQTEGVPGPSQSARSCSCILQRRFSCVPLRLTPEAAAELGGEAEHKQQQSSPDLLGCLKGSPVKLLSLLFLILIPPSCCLHATEEDFSFSDSYFCRSQTWLTVTWLQVFNFKVRPPGSNLCVIPQVFLCEFKYFYDIQLLHYEGVIIICERLKIRELLSLQSAHVNLWETSICKWFSFSF